MLNPDRTSVGAESSLFLELAPTKAMTTFLIIIIILIIIILR